jgi:hypothetical protein
MDGEAADPARDDRCMAAPAVHQAEGRRDLAKYLRSAKEGDMLPRLRVCGPSTDLGRVSDGGSGDAPGARRLADLLPDSRLIEIEDGSTLIRLDQPTRLAGAIRGFVRELVANHSAIRRS